jgi:putative membrane protein
MGQAPQWIPYCGEAPGPEVWLGRWNLDPVLGTVLGVLWFALWVAPVRADVPSKRRRDALRCAWGLTVLLYVSPLCALGSAFFTARVVHHMALVLVLAPLLAIGLDAWLRRLAMAPWTCTVLATLAFWTWHAPAAYEAALSSDAVFWLMQLTVLASATAFWAAIRRAAPAVALAAILASMVAMGLLGALIAFAAQALYAPHLASTLAWGVSPLADQQLAGIIMWAPGSLAYLGAALWIGWRWLRAERHCALRIGPA